MEVESCTASLAAAQRALSTAGAGSAAQRAALRALERAADDAEVAAEEADGPSGRALAAAADAARGAVAEARSAARGAARADAAATRRALLGGAEEKVDRDAEKVAEDITAGLRRVTGIVQEEIDRTVATGEVVDDSSKRLGMVRDVHQGYGGRVAEGARTLKGLAREERMANMFLAACFVAFFLVAFVIAKRRVANSNSVTYLVAPLVRVGLLPARVLRAVGRAALSGGTVEQGGKVGSDDNVGTESPPSARRKDVETPPAEDGAGPATGGEGLDRLDQAAEVAAGGAEKEGL